MHNAYGAVLLGLLLMGAGTAGVAADVRLQVGDVKDSRTTGQFFAGLEIELKLLGDDLDGAKGLRCTVTNAVDDTGRNLLEADDDDAPEFDELDADSPGQNTVTVKLKNPARKATTVKRLAGLIEIFQPAADPACMLTVSNVVGRPKFAISHPTLSAAKVQLTVLPKEQQEQEQDVQEETAKPPSPEAGMEQLGAEMGKAFSGMFGGMMGGGENSVKLRVVDPQSRLIKLEFLNAAGKEVETSGRMTMGETRVYDFSEPLPQPTRMRVYVATPKAVVRIPFALGDIALP